MFARVKVVGRRRYVYLAEGVREGRKVRQKTLCYLGPLARLAWGVPEKAKTKANERFLVDWGEIEDRISKIPLTFEELEVARRDRYARWLREGRRSGPSTLGGRPRTEGELYALSSISATRFRELFEEVGERAYRMR
jgi:hypothetical protein